MSKPKVIITIREKCDIVLNNSGGRITRREMLALTMAIGTSNARSQTSSRPLSFIVPQPAGNPSDGMARKIQPILQRELSQTVIVENIPGAGGSIGLAKTLASPPGAFALMIASQTEPILTPLALSSARYTSEDFRCIGLTGRAPYVLVGRPTLAARTHSELIEISRQSVGQPYAFGHIGHGSMIHLLGKDWGRRTGVTLNHVPYRGVPPVIQDLLGGQIDLSFLPLAGSVPSLLDSGKLRVYGSTSDRSTARTPNLPLLPRQDPALASFVHEAWGGVFVSRTTPIEVTEQVHKALTVALDDSEVRAYFESTGLERFPTMTLTQLEDFYRTEIGLYQNLARAVGIERQ